MWARLEGYPWWPAMVRGVTRGGKVFNSVSRKYHVQFFDIEPTRAWIRKGFVSERIHYH